MPPLTSRRLLAVIAACAVITLTAMIYAIVNVQDLRQAQRNITNNVTRVTAVVSHSPCKNLTRPACLHRLISAASPADLQTLRGPRGYRGRRGAAGRQGVRGVRGAIGPRGLTLIRRVVSVVRVFRPGLIGPQGPPGPAGAPGVQVPAPPAVVGPPSNPGGKQQSPGAQPKSGRGNGKH